MQKNVEHLMSVYLSTECFESNHGALSPAFVSKFTSKLMHKGALRTQGLF